MSEMIVSHFRNPESGRVKSLTASFNYSILFFFSSSFSFSSFSQIHNLKKKYMELTLNAINSTKKSIPSAKFSIIRKD